MANRLAGKIVFLLLLTATVGFASGLAGFSLSQVISITIFFSSVFATLLFWDFRVAIAFLGVAVLLFSKTVDLENFVKFASLEVILFLVGMMVLVGLLKQVGFFAWLVTLVLKIKRLTAKKFVFAISLLSALLACSVDEVTSIIFMVALILEICDYFEVEPAPYIIISIIATNIGSSGTVLGNPIGILIASKAGLTFEDFIIRAFPLMIFCLTTAIFLLLFWYRKELKKLDKNIRALGANEMLIKLISVPPEKELRFGLGVFGLTLLSIAMHSRLEALWNLETNTILMSAPLFFAGCVMIWKWRSAREYIEKDVEWWTLLFFLLLFAKAGTLKYTGATDVFAGQVAQLANHNSSMLVGIVLWASAIGSSILDNVVLVAAFIPVIQSLKELGFALQPLWWALLFGGCLGGNITLIGSTANIVALGILEREKKVRINFFSWLGVGLSVGLLTTFIVWLALTFIPFYR